MHRHARQGGDFVIMRTDTILRDEGGQELDSRGSDRFFSEKDPICGGANAEGRQLQSLRI